MTALVDRPVIMGLAGGRTATRGRSRSWVGAARRQPPWRGRIGDGVSGRSCDRGRFDAGDLGREAVAVVTGELPDLPHLPELPERGAGAEMIGRTAALLTAVARDFAITTVPTGWQITGQVGSDMRRARSWLGEDCDRLEQALSGSDGMLKVQVCGPWTWAASVEDGSGRRLVRDDAFVDDLTHAPSEAILVHVADLRRRIPAARWWSSSTSRAFPPFWTAASPRPAAWAGWPPSRPGGQRRS